jgi:hypothetical protein
MPIGCTKDTVVPSVKSPWDTCSNKFTKEFNIRKGKWIRYDGRARNPIGLDFISDSILNVQEDGNKWVNNVKYILLPCYELKYNQYWIQPQHPSAQYWQSYLINYNEKDNEVYLAYYLHQWGMDTLKFKKE